MRLSDNFFKKVEKKTSVDKDTILSLAEKLQDDNMKNEDALRDVIKQISILTGKEVPKEKEDKIINTIMQDKVPDNLDDYIK
ncbi:MAG: stage VI sporulation protein F [Bacilli bacterium]